MEYRRVHVRNVYSILFIDGLHERLVRDTTVSPCAPRAFGKYFPKRFHCRRILPHRVMKKPNEYNHGALLLNARVLVAVQRERDYHVEIFDAPNYSIVGESNVKTRNTSRYFYSHKYRIWFDAHL